jgi:hypothetical protein
MELSRDDEPMQPVEEDENFDELLKEVDVSSNQIVILQAAPISSDVPPPTHVDEETAKAREKKAQRKKLLDEMREKQKASQVHFCLYLTCF